MTIDESGKSWNERVRRSRRINQIFEEVVRRSYRDPFLRAAAREKWNNLEVLRLVNDWCLTLLKVRTWKLVYNAQLYNKQEAIHHVLIWAAHLKAHTVQTVSHQYAPMESISHHVLQASKIACDSILNTRVEPNSCHHTTKLKVGVGLTTRASLKLKFSK